MKRWWLMMKHWLIKLDDEHKNHMYFELATTRRRVYVSIICDKHKDTIFQLPLTPKTAYSLADGLRGAAAKVAASTDKPDEV